MRDAEAGVAPSDPRARKTNEAELASLVGQLERYAEQKTGRGPAAAASDRFGGSNAINRQRGAAAPASPKSKWAESRDGDRWGSRRGPASRRAPPEKAAAEEDDDADDALWARASVDPRRRVRTKDDEDENASRYSTQSHPYENSLVGAWDAASSRGGGYAATTATDLDLDESDARSAYSAAADFDALTLPDAPEDRFARVGDRFEGVSDNLERHRQRLEQTMRAIEDGGFGEGRNAHAGFEREGMPTAGKTTTGVGLIDVFAKGDAQRAKEEREAERARRAAANKWLSPAPGKARDRGSSCDGGGEGEEGGARKAEGGFGAFLAAAFPGCCGGGAGRPGKGGEKKKPAPTTPAREEAFARM